MSGTMCDAQSRSFSEFEKAMVELNILQHRLTEEHAREIAHLHSVIARMNQHDSDKHITSAPIKQPTEFGHLAPIPPERSKDELSAPQKCSVSDVDVVRAQDGFSTAQGSSTMDADGMQYSSEVVPYSSSGVVQYTSEESSYQVGDSPAAPVMASIEEVCSEESDDGNEVGECSMQFERSSSEKDEDEEGNCQSRDSGKANLVGCTYSQKGSLGSFVSRVASMIGGSTTAQRSTATLTASITTAGTGLSSASMAATQSEKATRKAQRLRSTLQARLRPFWNIDEEMAVLVPRWSQSSQQSIVTLSDLDTEDKARSEDQGSKRFSSAVKPFHLTPSLSGFFSAGARPRGKGHGCFLEGCTIHPQSCFKIMFDILGLLIMGYDFIMTPIIFFDLPESNLMSVMGWITRIFWTLDMFLNFRVATYIHGSLVTNWREIATHYLKTMFILDFAIILIEWLSYLMEITNIDGRSLENLSLLRVMKALRFAKVIRLLKFERILQEFRAQVNSTLVLLYIRPLILVFFLLVLNHSIACVWYGIGKSSDGWTSLEVLDSSFWYMYATSLHWAVSQLHGNMDVFPQNLPERLFMCSTAIVALILYSTFLSAITNGMAELHALRAERHERHIKLRSVLARRNVSLELSMKIKKRMDYLTSAKTELEAETAMLARLPKDLLTDLYQESRRPSILGHNFFFMLDCRGPRIVRQLCHDSMSEASYFPDEKVFSAGDAGLGMSFVVNGSLIYTRIFREPRGGSLESGSRSQNWHNQTLSSCQETARLTGSQPGSHAASQGGVSDSNASLSVLRSQDDSGSFVMKGFWVSEASLWMTWEYCGHLTTRNPSLLLNLDANSFAEVVSQFHFAHVNSSRYARQFIERMVEQGMRTDIMSDIAN